MFIDSYKSLERAVNLWHQSCFTCIVMQEASDAHSKTADSDTVSTYQVSSVQLTDRSKQSCFTSTNKKVPHL